MKPDRFTEGDGFEATEARAFSHEAGRRGRPPRRARINSSNFNPKRLGRSDPSLAPMRLILDRLCPGSQGLSSGENSTLPAIGGALGALYHLLENEHPDRR
jgi:hypothetical protein